MLQVVVPIVALIAAALPAPAAAQSVNVSAQQRNKNVGRVAAPTARPQINRAPQVNRATVTTRSTTVTRTQGTVVRSGAGTKVPQNAVVTPRGGRVVTTPGAAAKTPGVVTPRGRVVTPAVVTPGVVTPGGRVPAGGVAPAGRVVTPGVVTPGGRVVTPGLAVGPGRIGPGPGRIGPGPGRVVVAPSRIAGPTVVLRNNYIAPIYAGPRRIWYGNRWRAFVPVATLGAVMVGTAYYWPQAYISAPRPACAGVTPDGCQLNWQTVGFEEGGDGSWQCVQYCPRPGAMPPPRVVALAPAAPPPTQAKCEIVIYSEPKFESAAVPTGEDQPRLSESGWQNQIASVEVKAGVWDMFTDEQFAGTTMRLSPGSYPELGPDWERRISSFMCVEPS